MAQWLWAGEWWSVQVIGISDNILLAIDGIADFFHKAKQGRQFSNTSLLDCEAKTYSKLYSNYSKCQVGMVVYCNTIQCCNTVQQCRHTVCTYCTVFTLMFLQSKK